jgi:hypothetical protein
VIDKDSRLTSLSISWYNLKSISMHQKPNKTKTYELKANKWQLRATHSLPARIQLLFPLTNLLQKIIDLILWASIDCVHMIINLIDILNPTRQFSKAFCNICTLRHILDNEKMFCFSFYVELVIPSCTFSYFDSCTYSFVLLSDYR